MEISPVERLQGCVLMKYILFLLVFPLFAVYGNTVQLTKELCQIEETQNYSDQNIRKAAAALTHRHYRVRFAAMRILIQAGKRCPEATPALLDTIKNPPQKHLPGFAVTTLLVTEPDAFAILEKFYDSATSDWKQTLANALWNLPGVPEKFRKKLRWSESGFKKNAPSQLANGGFENGLENWELICRDGAAGKIVLQNKIVRSGSKALQIEKSNGLGFLELRSKKLVRSPQMKPVFSADITIRTTLRQNRCCCSACRMNAARIFQTANGIRAGGTISDGLSVTQELLRREPGRKI